MSLARHAKKVDANQRAIVERFRAAGCSVAFWGANGAPDLVVGIRGVTILVEIKDGRKPPSARRLTAAQQKWHQAWKGDAVVVVESVEQVGPLLSSVVSEGGGLIW